MAQIVPSSYFDWMVLNEDGSIAGFLDERGNVKAFGAVATAALADGSYGDIGVSNNGTTLTVGNGTITTAKLATVAAGLLGSTAGGSPEVVPFATVKTNLALTKTDVSLANVDNTSDVNKPVSSATQAALDAKASLTAVDSRALRKFTAAPTTEGTDGDIGLLVTAPQAGTLFLKTSGTWARLTNSYSWTARPSAASYPGEVINITDWNMDFVSDGTRWIPAGKRLTITQYSTQSTATAGTGSDVIVATDTIPAGLIAPHCTLRFAALWSFVTTGASTKVIKIRSTETGTVITNVTPNATSVAAHVQTYLYVTESVAAQRCQTSAADKDGFVQNTTSVNLSVAVNMANAHSWEWTAQANAVDTHQLLSRTLEITWP